MAALDRPADRLVYFSDAVVAIAITLLVLPLVDLVHDMVERHQTVRELVTENLGPIGAFVLGFVVIARLWMAHHTLFDGVERVDVPLIWLDMLWLLTIVVLPFPTALTGVRGSDPLTVRLYIGVLTVNMLTLTALGLLVRRSGRGSGEGIDASIRGTGVTAILLVAVFFVSLVVPNFLVLLVLFVSGPVERAYLAWRRRRADR